MNRKQFFKSVIFIGIFLVTFVSVSYMLRTNGEVKDRFSGFYAEERDTLDIVMIGSSPVFPFYAAPMLWGETGIAAYPLSSNVQRPVAMKYLVEEVKKTQSPSLYIFEMRMFTMDDEGLKDNMAYTRGVTDNLRYSWNRIRTIQAMVPETEDRLSFYIDLFKYHTNWKMLMMPSEWKNWRYHKESELKGFYIKDEVGPTIRPEAGGMQGKLAIPDSQETYLKDLLQYLQDNKLQALFIVSPYGETPEEQQMFNYMAEIVEEMGYPFLNMNNYYDEIGIVFEEDYADYGSHTNIVGADKCTAFLEAYLLEHYQFTDKRGDSAYASWDRAYDLWLEQSEEARSLLAERIRKQEYAVKEEEE
ncbi:MAG: SGNH/GDSL hydrolase family protein [Blautia sp.]|nr:SGNH/GDSL hydrolase family protein [Lachnoclostridium sp.]MCM1211763.1 SGNH/GDSL hydrolase family protein [Blautia sp.]